MRMLQQNRRFNVSCASIVASLFVIVVFSCPRSVPAQQKDGNGPGGEASESSTMLAMVREGLGVTILPRTLLPDKLEGITAIPLEPAHALRIGLAVRSLASASPAALLFVQTAVAWVQEQVTLLPSAR